MAWVRCCGGTAKYNPKDIIKDGILNTRYSLTGNIIQAGTRVEIVRDGNGNGGSINGVDLTNINTLTLDYQNNNGSTPMEYKIGNGSWTLLASDSSRHTLNINVSSYTGVTPIYFNIYSNNGWSAIYNLIGA